MPSTRKERSREGSGARLCERCRQDSSRSNGDWRMQATSSRAKTFSASPRRCVNAKRAHAVSLAELRQADVDPVEDWAVWYAEYLLGVR